MNQRKENYAEWQEKVVILVLAFFPVVASSTNLSTSIQPQSYTKKRYVVKTYR